MFIHVLNVQLFISTLWNIIIYLFTTYIISLTIFVFIFYSYGFKMAFWCQVRFTYFLFNFYCHFFSNFFFFIFLGFCWINQKMKCYNNILLHNCSSSSLVTNWNDPKKEMSCFVASFWSSKENKIVLNKILET